MFQFSDLSPWWVIDADDKKTARLTLTAQLLDQLPYGHPSHSDIGLPKRQERLYERPPIASHRFIPVRNVISNKSESG